VPLTVVTLSVEPPELPGMVEGLKFAVAPGGNPETVKATSPAPPDSGVIVIPKLASPPDGTTFA